VVDKINRLAKPNGSVDEKPRLPVRISDSGQIDCAKSQIECTKFYSRQVHS
jgi:hypothetical protein